MDGEYMDFLVEIGDPKATAVVADVCANSDRRYADFSTVIDWDSP